MSKKSVQQRQLATGQPYTEVMSSRKYEEVETSEGEKGYVVVDCLQVTGYTLEEKLQPDKGEDPVWKLEWEEHDLGQAATLEEAYKIAADWHDGLRGVYELR